MDAQRFGDLPPVFELEQEVELTEWQAEGLPELRERYSRAGLLLLEHSVSEERWRRRIVEYISDAQFLGELAGATVERDVLRAKHADACRERRIEYALESPLEIDSNLQNSDVALVGVERLPVPHRLLYLPTLTPVAPPAVVPPGGSWPGEIRVEARGGLFSVAYSVTMIQQEEDGSRVSIEVDRPQEPEFTGDEVLASLQPTGEWTTLISRVDCVPLQAEGVLGTKIRLRYYSMRGEAMDVIVLSISNSFRYRRIPASFDEAMVDLSAWDPSGDGDRR